MFAQCLLRRICLIESDDIRYQNGAEDTEVFATPIIQVDAMKEAGTFYEYSIYF